MVSARISGCIRLPTGKVKGKEYSMWTKGEQNKRMPCLVRQSLIFRCASETAGTGERSMRPQAKKPSEIGTCESSKTDRVAHEESEDLNGLSLRLLVGAVVIPRVCPWAIVLGIERKQAA